MAVSVPALTPCVIPVLAVILQILYPLWRSHCNVPTIPITLQFSTWWMSDSNSNGLHFTLCRMQTERKRLANECVSWRRFIITFACWTTCYADISREPPHSQIRKSWRYTSSVLLSLSIIAARWLLSQMTDVCTCKWTTNNLNLILQILVVDYK